VATALLLSLVNGWDTHEWANRRGTGPSCGAQRGLERSCGRRSTATLTLVPHEVPHEVPGVACPQPADRVEHGRWPPRPPHAHRQECRRPRAAAAARSGSPRSPCRRVATAACASSGHASRGLAPRPPSHPAGSDGRPRRGGLGGGRRRPPPPTVGTAPAWPPSARAPAARAAPCATAATAPPRSRCARRRRGRWRGGGGEGGGGGGGRRGRGVTETALASAAGRGRSQPQGWSLSVGRRAAQRGWPPFAGGGRRSGGGARATDGMGHTRSQGRSLKGLFCVPCRTACCGTRACATGGCCDGAPVHTPACPVALWPA